MLTVRGKALEAGAVGDVVGVLNIQSNRPVQAHRHRAWPRLHRRRRAADRHRRGSRNRRSVASSHPVSVPTMHSRLVSSSVSPSPLNRSWAARRSTAWPPGRAAAAVGDRKPDHQARLQARPHADADAAARLLQPELAVAERLPRLLQGSARAPGRRHPHGHGQSQRQGGDRQRDPAQPGERGGFRRRQSVRRQEGAADEHRDADAASSPPIPTPPATARAR